ncbi:hypothetical protein GP486_004677 [Trichoglossum hirsutum]|uniref:Uncharacterized protein n=1 Tax=Trichoglossum hirsutum TaxID=265104 RepID=A0A9P8LAW9_9PEZI|nr:hypothetical protein GP486_004677 [Trichoglossum hirsutum]
MCLRGMPDYDMPFEHDVFLCQLKLLEYKNFWPLPMYSHLYGIKGMLASAETIRTVASAFRTHDLPVSVVDPVMVSKSGAQLLPKNAVQALREELLKFTTVFTPNVPEAQVLLQDAGQTIADPRSLEDIIDMAKRIHALGPRYVLVKGGHMPLHKDPSDIRGEHGRQAVVNVLYGNDEITLIEMDYINTKNTHGTGCSLASAIACNLASGQDVPVAVRKASRYVAAAIKTSSDLGRGSGPINHFHSTYSLPFAPGDFVEYLLNRSDVKGVWGDYTEHEFVNRLADGTLPIDAFKYFLIQDYLFLIQFARANALASYKGKAMSDIARSADILNHTRQEIALHIRCCEEFGISENEISSYQEHQGRPR